jgi:site-specific DNA-methyltransferase (cytosine-N4-specific)
VDIRQGDARALDLPDESVDLIVTSPPYFGLRDYGTADQLGAEITPAEYIAELVKCTAEMVRVLKPSGSIFVNLGDKYAPNKSLRLLPERYRIACTDELGLIARAVLVWSKPNGLPESVTDRVRRSHEDWIHLTRSPRYYAAVDEIREPHAPDSIRSSRQAAERPRRADRYPQTGHYTTSDASGFGAGERRLNPLGKLPGSVWEIATQPLRVPAELGVDHFAAFPMEWPRRLILGWSPVGGTVLDPFGGTGTTALVADALGRHGISVDLSEDYCRLAQWRVNDPKQRERASRPAGAKPVRARRSPNEPQVQLGVSPVVVPAEVGVSALVGDVPALPRVGVHGGGDELATAVDGGGVGEADGLLGHGQSLAGISRNELAG